MKRFTLLLSLLFSVILSVTAQSVDPSQYEDMIKQMFSGMGKATTLPEYKFPLFMKMKVKTYSDDNDGTDTDLGMYINSEKKIVGIDGSAMEGGKEDADMITVFDNTNNSLLIFNQKEKTLMAMNTGAFKNMGIPGMSDDKKDSIEKEESSVKCSKTGKTKTILGYSCYEYSCTTDDDKSKTSIWISEDAKLGDLNYLSGLGASGGFGKTYGMKGTVLAMENYNKEGKLATTMTVTEINKSAGLTIKTSDYKMQQMPMLGN